jgi:CheY-like chemotaxis protein
MDHMMPGLDGIDTTKALRSMGGKYLDQIIIALSANAISGVRELFLGAGMNDFISKPIMLGDLRQILLTYLPKEKQAPSEGKGGGNG